MDDHFDGVIDWVASRVGSKRYARDLLDSNRHTYTDPWWPQPFKKQPQTFVTDEDDVKPGHCSHAGTWTIGDA